MLEKLRKTANGFSLTLFEHIMKYFGNNEKGNCMENREKVNQMLWKAWFGIFLLITGLCITIACGKKETDEEKKTPVSFLICEQKKLPDELLELIEEKKASPFQLTFQNSAHLYIVVGYGQQPRGEYVVAVRELYETEKGIYADTTLVSLSYVKDRKTGEPSTYPYVVLKCEKSEKPVFFL